MVTKVNVDWPMWNQVSPTKILENHTRFFSSWNPYFYSKGVYGTPFLQENVGEIQIYCTSLKVHHGHLRGFFLVFIAFLLIIFANKM